MNCNGNYFISLLVTFCNSAHTSCGWIFGHRWEALDVRTLRGKRLLQLQVIQPLDKGNPTSRQEVIESPDHGQPPLLGLSRRVASCSSALECLQITLSRPQVYPERTLSQRWRSAKKRQRGDIAHCRGHTWNASKLPDVQIHKNTDGGSTAKHSKALSGQIGSYLESLFSKSTLHC